MSESATALTGEAPANNPAQAAPAQPTTAAATPPGASAQAAADSAAQPAATPHWTSSFKNEELKGYMQNKGFSDPEAAALSYWNLEKLKGVPEDKLLKVPDSFVDDKEQLTPEARAIYERLGAPKDISGYELEKVAGQGADKSALEWYAKKAHELGMTVTQAKALFKANAEREAGAAKAQVEKLTADFAAADKTLRQEWGQAFEQNMKNVKVMRDKLGHTDEMSTALAKAVGPLAAMKYYHQAATAFGESTFVNSQRPVDRILEPASASSKIKELMADKGFAAKFIAGDSQAVRQMQALQEQANPGETRLG